MRLSVPWDRLQKTTILAVPYRPIVRAGRRCARVIKCARGITTNAAHPASRHVSSFLDTSSLIALDEGEPLTLRALRHMPALYIGKSSAPAQSH